MLSRRRPFPAILFAVVATTAGIGLVQMARHRLQATEATSDASGGAKREQPACASREVRVEAPRAADSASVASRLSLRMDYAGAESLVGALERGSLSDADVDSLLRIRGLCAMVDNVTRFIPEIQPSAFRQEIRAFARTKRGARYDRYYQLSGVWGARSEIRALAAAIRTNERRIASETAARLERYRPDTGTLEITAYFVAGGVSGGFAFEKDPGSFYANLARANGDLNGVVSNMAHEAYHVMQFRAQEQAGIDPRSLAADSTPPLERLFATTLSEGTANYVVDPSRDTAAGPNMDSARARYRRHAEPQRIAENFARFDAVAKGLRDGRLTWEKAYLEGFTSENDESFYFVGYEMAKALERHCGRECIGRLFAERPVAFFRRYVALYRTHPELTGRFSPETEATIASYGLATGR